MNRPTKPKHEIRADLDKILAQIIAECYVIQDDFKINNVIRNVHFKTFLLNKADEITEQQKFLNNIS